MKKSILTLLCVGLSTLAASAQSYIGGTVGFNVSNPDANDDETKTTSFVIAPEFGRELNDKWTIGTGLGFNHSTSKNQSDYHDIECKTSIFTFSPYARYSFADLGRARFFMQGGLSLGKGVAKTTSNDTYESDSSKYKVSHFGIAFRPGIKFAVCDRIDLLALIGNVGYNVSSSKNDDYDVKTKTKSFQCAFSTEDISIGAVFKL